MQVPRVAVARSDSAHLAVGVVEDHVLAFAMALDHDAVPPGEHWSAPIVLHLEVPGARVLAKPHYLSVVVEDHRTVLPGALLDG